MPESDDVGQAFDRAMGQIAEGSPPEMTASRGFIEEHFGRLVKTRELPEGGWEYTVQPHCSPLTVHRSPGIRSGDL